MTKEKTKKEETIKALAKPDVRVMVYEVAPRELFLQVGRVRGTLLSVVFDFVLKLGR
jgi:hypothetical protein